MKIIIIGIVLLIAVETSAALFAFNSQPVAVHPVVVAAKQDGNGLQLYSYLLGLPSDKQKEFHRRLTAAERASVWRIHFANTLVLNNRLSDVQQNFLIELMRATTEENFKDGPSPVIREFQAKARSLFTKEEGADIFANIRGGGQKITYSPMSRPDCSCNKLDDWCIGSTCHSISCTVYGSGCGFMWVEECNGGC